MCTGRTSRGRRSSGTSGRRASWSRRGTAACPRARGGTCSWAASPRSAGTTSTRSCMPGVATATRSASAAPGPVPAGPSGRGQARAPGPGSFFIAGHATIASALTWTWYLLSTHPACWRRLRAEVGEVLGDRPPAVADLPRLAYTAMVVQEAMRLYPPIYLVLRRAMVDDEVGGYRIAAGANIALCPYVTHRHPGFWDNPEGFEPERFAPRRPVGATAWPSSPSPAGPALHRRGLRPAPAPPGGGHGRPALPPQPGPLPPSRGRGGRHPPPPRSHAHAGRPGRLTRTPGSRGPGRWRGRTARAR
jgi:Cytochrome P450